MSYRGFKRLFGETSIERKCRIILGLGMFSLVSASFFFYGSQTEKLVWDQTKKKAAILVHTALIRRHILKQADLPATSPPADLNSPLPEKQPDTKASPQSDVKSVQLEMFQDTLPEDMRKYEVQFLRPFREGQPPFDYRPRDSATTRLFELLRQGKTTEEVFIDRDHRVFKYIGAIPLKKECMSCHPGTPLDKKLHFEYLKEGDLFAGISLEISLTDTEVSLNINRAYLISFAVITAIFTMLFAFVTIRYVVLKPVTHLKDVSDEIASGNLSVRASIQTGDEFQELSQAFNRMLRSLVSMQDELRKVNSDLDGKLDELAQANMALFEMNRLKSEFLATISHELRTPLNSILGFSDLLTDVPTMNDRQKKWVTNIQSSGRVLLERINDILDLAKLEAGKMQIHVEEFSLRDLVEGQIQLHRPMADKKNIDLAGDVDSQIPILTQDPAKLSQILSNLLSNAIKFTPEGGQIKIVSRPDRAHIVIDVVDNGVGVSAEDQKIIFEKFRQAESSLTRPHGGTGLGLSIVRELTKLLGGDEVKLTSEVGRGSTFSIRLPMHFTPERPMEMPLGDMSLDIAKARLQETRLLTSKPRVPQPEPTT